jgi:hypothetical protein
MQALLDSWKEGAEARKASAQANLPFGGAQVHGPAGQIVGLEMVKQQYGENSPQYQQAQKAFQLSQQGVQSRLDYQNSLTENAGKRFSTPLARTAQEFEDIKNGLMPGTKTPLTPEQREQYQGLYGLKFLKDTTDEDTRKRNLFAKNMDITISQIDPQALTQYSGLEGATNLLKDRALSLKGVKVPRYKAYEENLTRAKTFAKQYRQYAADSITPSMQNDLKTLTNPSSWLIHPEIAMDKYNTFVNLLKQETGTYQQATKSPDIYSGGSSQEAHPAPPAQGPQGNPGAQQQMDDQQIQQWRAEAIAQGVDPAAIDEEIARIKGGAQ